MTEFAAAVVCPQPLTYVIQIEWVHAVQTPRSVQAAEFQAELRALERALLQLRAVSQQDQFETRPEMVLIAL